MHVTETRRCVNRFVCVSSSAVHLPMASFFPGGIAREAFSGVNASAYGLFAATKELEIRIFEIADV